MALLVRYQRIWFALALICAAAVILFASRDMLSTSMLIGHEQHLRDTVASHPVRTVIIGFLIFTILSLIPGLTGKATIVGWIFGFWSGLVIVHFGLLIAGLLEFWFTRYYFHEYIESRFGLHLLRLNSALKRDGTYYLFMLRMAHMPYTFTNYAMGATKIRTSAFVLATATGMLPSNALFVYAGSRVPTLEEIVIHGPQSIFSPGLIVSLLLLATTPLIGRLLRRTPEDKKEE